MTDALQLKFFKYFEIFKISYYTNTAYIGDVFGIAAIVAVRIWFFSQLYGTAFRVSGATEVGGLSLAQTLWILALTQSFHVSARTRIIMKSIELEIKSGSVVYSMNKPYSYLLFNFFTCFGAIGGNFFITIVCGILVAVLLAGMIKLTLIGIAAGLFLLFFGFILNTLAILIIGLSAFWAEDVSAFRWIYDKILWIVGGIFIPLTVFPQKVQRIIEFLPFNQMFYGPARLMINFDPRLFYKFLLIQLFWMVIFALSAVWVYKKGTKNLSINGG